MISVQFAVYERANGWLMSVDVYNQENDHDPFVCLYGAHFNMPNHPSEDLCTDGEDWADLMGRRMADLFEKEFTCKHNDVDGCAVKHVTRYDRERVAEQDPLF